ncbi:hypothetical protein [Hankyongella ginsenosidimutans]|uniref:hypothetical protein n=1 Tax=Hankyongella ginsenosidimutans TaxID=1763828 RepID=UPI001FEA74EC|nr:hypothetical protein [Hankyongella ginsenosidimutans]
MDLEIAKRGRIGFGQARGHQLRVLPRRLQGVEPGGSNGLSLNLVQTSGDRLLDPGLLEGLTKLSARSATV